MTPEEYFKGRDYTARASHSFCAGFPTMRAAWLDDGCLVDWMLSFLARDESNVPGLVAFARFCADSAMALAPDNPNAHLARRSSNSEARRVEGVAYMAGVTASSAAFTAFAEAGSKCKTLGMSDQQMIAAENAAVASARQAQREELRRLFPTQFEQKDPTCR